MSVSLRVMTGMLVVAFHLQRAFPRVAGVQIARRIDAAGLTLR
jgi:hypothetical protein